MEKGYTTLELIAAIPKIPGMDVQTVSMLTLAIMALVTAIEVERSPKKE